MRRVLWLGLMAILQLMVWAPIVYFGWHIFQTGVVQ